MIVPERPWASRASQKVRALSSRKNVMIASATPFLAAGFILAGTSTAAATATLTETLAATPNAVAFDTDPCRGGQSGVCPMFSTQPVQSDGQSPARQVSEL